MKLRERNAPLAILGNSTPLRLKGTQLLRYGHHASPVHVAESVGRGG